MKAAWLIISGPNQRKVEAAARIEVIADTYLSMNAPIQWVLPTLLGQRREFQQQLIARVRENIAELDKQLAGQKSCNRLEVEGGWSAVIRVPATRSDEDLALALLSTKGVYVHPGHFYDFPSEGYLVVSLIIAEFEFIEGMSRVLALL
jgi:aspartate/methionine/tyrosine aminotransferase